MGYSQYPPPAATSRKKDLTSTSYTLQSGDEGQILEFDNTSATTITIPNDSTFNFGTGTQIDIMQVSTGEITISPASGVTLNASDDGFKIRAQWSAAAVIKRSSNTWVLIGDTIA